MDTRVFKLSAVFLLVLVTAMSVVAQWKVKPWKEWSKKEAEKILEDSPWARTQVETNLSEMFYSPTSAGRNATNVSNRSVEGATNQEINLSYHIRFFTARPIREAFARIYQLKAKPDSQTNIGLQNFTEIKPTNVIILTVTFDCPDRRFSGKVMQAFNSAVTATLKNSTYLERSDGKRLFLEEYVPPGPDGFGARFIFPRNVKDAPFISLDASEVRFFSEYSSNIKLDRRFKISDLMVNGKLEY